MIEFKNVEISYGDFVAIENLNLTINQGEFFTFLGPSGCGKTTTLRSLVGFVKPTKGEIAVEGRVVNEVPIEKRGIGIVFQSYALFPTMTVWENLAFGLKVKKTPKDQVAARIKDVAEKVALSDEMLQRGVAELSGGQQQRVALARAIVLEPQILCLDEPLSNLDAKLRVSLRSELKRLQKQLGITTLYVTHDQEEALTMSDRIAVFNNGYVEQVGTPLEIYNQSASKFVCDFIGDINRLSPELVAEAQRQSGAALDAGREGFIRLERVNLSPLLPHDVTLNGTVVGTSYNGLFTLYTVETPLGWLRCFETNSGEALKEVGDAVALHFNAGAILQY